MIQEPMDGGMGSSEREQSTRLFLIGEAGAVKEIAVETERRSTEPEGTSSEHAQRDCGVSGGELVPTDRGHEDEAEVCLELLRREEELERVAQELEDTVIEVERLKGEVRQERERYKQLWRMNCADLAEHDALLPAKDEEIASLQQQLSETRSVAFAGDVEEDHTGALAPLTGRTVATATTHGDTGRERSGRAPSTARRQGKAPPVDPFTGENPEVHFDDWLPALVCAAEWNQWTPEECLIQLAGHLRGQALQEWNLLSGEEKNNWERASSALSIRLDPGSKVIAAQDFRHTIQEETEGVANFIRRLERTFRIAYGGDHFSQETREALLYGQLQEGLCPDLMQNSTVAGASTYKSLCMAAQNEEQRKAEMKRRWQYQSGAEGKDQRAGSGRQREHLSTIPLKTNPGGTKLRPTNTHQDNRPATTGQERTRVCYQCGKPGHFARECRSHKSESRGPGHVSKKQAPSARQVTSNTTEKLRVPDPEDPVSYLASDSDDAGEVKLVQVMDKGSQPRRAQVQIGGVPAWGIVDSGRTSRLLGNSCSKLLQPSAS